MKHKLSLLLCGFFLLPAPAALAASGPPPVGQLAQVVSMTATITAPRSAGSRVLFRCPKGQFLAILGQTSSQYTVLMRDRSVGLVPKENVKILGYEVVNAAPPTSADLPAGIPAIRRGTAMPFLKTGRSGGWGTGCTSPAITRRLTIPAFTSAKATSSMPRQDMVTKSPLTR